MNTEQNVMQRIPDDHPLMVAWNEFKASDDYEKTKQWATAPAHTEGSLWAVFMAGWYKACALQQPASFMLKPLVWEALGDSEWCCDKGFHITREDEDPELKGFAAEWGESGPEYFDTLEEAQADCARQWAEFVGGQIAPEQPAAKSVPEGMIERIHAAMDRIHAGHAPRRIPADPTDIDLVLAEVLAWAQGLKPPFWLEESKPATKSNDKEPGDVPLT